MRVLARFTGPNGEISVVEERSTGGRRYYEGGVEQSYVLAGGEAGVAYICLMSALLDNGGNVLLLGCAGGALAGMLHRRGRSVAVVDANPISFASARTTSWIGGNKFDRFRWSGLCPATTSKRRSDRQRRSW